MAAPPPILAVTTPALEGQRISRYLGVVAGEAILGTGFDRDLIAGFRDFTGGRVTGWEELFSIISPVIHSRLSLWFRFYLW